MSIRVGPRPVPVPHETLLTAPTLRAAERELSLALDSARAGADARTATLLETWRGLVRARRGRVDDALSDLELVTTRATDAGVATPRVALAALLDCHLTRGDLWRASRLGRQLGRAGTPDTIPDALAHQALGDLAGAEHDHPTAWEHHVAAGRTLGSSADRPGILSWRLGAAVAAVHLGRRPEATDLIEAQVRLAAEDGRGFVRAAALRAQAAISESSAREALLEQALRLTDPVDTPRLASQVATDLATHLLLGGQDRARARSLLRSAESLTLECGLRTGRDRIGRLLPLLGEEPRTPPGTRRDALSPLQLLLARGAAEGRTDEELAASLLLDAGLVRREVQDACRALHVRVRHRIADALTLPRAG